MSKIRYSTNIGKVLNYSRSQTIRIINKAVGMYVVIKRKICKKDVILMSEEQKMIIEATSNMSKNKLREILSFIRYIQYRSDDFDEAPDELIIKNDEDFLEKIKEGMEESKEISFEEAMSRMERKIMPQRGN